MNKGDRKNLLWLIVIIAVILFTVVGIIDTKGSHRLVCSGVSNVGNAIKVTFYLEEDDSIKSYDIAVNSEYERDLMSRFIEGYIFKNTSKYDIAKFYKIQLGFNCKEY